MPSFAQSFMNKVPKNPTKLCLSLYNKSFLLAAGYNTSRASFDTVQREGQIDYSVNKNPKQRSSLVITWAKMKMGCLYSWWRKCISRLFRMGCSLPLSTHFCHANWQGSNKAFEEITTTLSPFRDKCRQMADSIIIRAPLPSAAFTVLKHCHFKSLWGKKKQHTFSKILCAASLTDL